MKFVCVSDTHNRLDRIDFPPGDVLIHAGDLTGRGSLDEIERGIKELAKLDYRYKILIAGNHDFGFEQQPKAVQQILTKQGPDIIYLLDQAVTIEGIKIYGSPWQPWFHNWAFNVERGQEIKKKWDLIPDDIDILITHGPPHGFRDLTAWGIHAGCEELLRVVRERVRPRYHIFGHIHEGYGAEKDPEHDITYVNASICTLSYAPNNLPIVIEI